MSRFCLGIIGKCASLQPWIEPSQLYHRLLRTLLREQNAIQLDISIAGNHTLEPYKRLLILSKKKPLDGLLYHMRYLERQLLFYSYRDASGKLRYSLHPHFFNRNEYTFEEVPVLPFLSARKSEDLHQIPPVQIPYRSLFGIPFRKVNFLGAKLCGLNKSVVENEWRYFEKLRKLCIDLNLPLFVVGPLPRVEKIGDTPFLSSLPTRKWAESRLSKLKIPHYTLHDLYDKNGVSLYKRDNFHLSIEGHAFLAKELHPIIAPWIQSILASKMGEPESLSKAVKQ